jgi:hypothetical protein
MFLVKMNTLFSEWDVMMANQRDLMMANQLSLLDAQRNRMLTTTLSGCLSVIMSVNITHVFIF